MAGGTGRLRESILKAMIWHLREASCSGVKLTTGGERGGEGTAWSPLVLGGGGAFELVAELEPLTVGGGAEEAAPLAVKSTEL